MTNLRNIQSFVLLLVLPIFAFFVSSAKAQEGGQPRVLMVTAVEEQGLVTEVQSAFHEIVSTNANAKVAVVKLGELNQLPVLSEAGPLSMVVLLPDLNSQQAQESLAILNQKGLLSSSSLLVVKNGLQLNLSGDVSKDPSLVAISESAAGPQETKFSQMARGFAKLRVWVRSAVFIGLSAGFVLGLNDSLWGVMIGSALAWKVSGWLDRSLFEFELAKKTIRILSRGKDLMINGKVLLQKALSKKQRNIYLCNQALG